MRKTDFLALLHDAVRAAADDALAAAGRSSQGCPWIPFWFDYYGSREAPRVERAIRRFAPEAARASRAEEYVPAITARVRRAVGRWSSSDGRDGAPAEIRSDPEVRAAGVAAVEHRPGPRILRRATRSDRVDADGRSLVEALGEGVPLDLSVRTRYELAFGTDLSAVRVHTDGGAGAMASRLNARAFAVGPHIAFAAGEYRPGSPAGDALIAHELAHVVQQDPRREPGRPSDGTALEDDADEAARIAVASSATGVRAALSRLGRTAMPRFRSGVGLRRCAGGTAPKFPSYSEIVADTGVQSATDTAWANTLAATTPTSRREEGFWIRLNTGTRTYQMTATIVAPTVGPATGASVNLGPRPADTPDPGGTVYTVGSFHTHTPTTHRTVGRPVGPSGPDARADTSDDVAGVVYDYVESPAGSGTIRAGHPLNSPAQRYHSGPERRMKE